MEAAEAIAREFEERTRPGRCSPHLEIKGDALILGPGAVLARRAAGPRGRGRVAFDERRAEALLARAFERTIDPHLLAKLRGAAEAWEAGDPALAQIRLAFAGLPPCDDPDRLLRLFVTEAILDAGASPDLLLKAQGLDASAFLKGYYNPDQPRDERGRWTEGGGATPAAHRSGGRLRALGEFLDWLKSRRRRSEPLGEAEPRGEAPERRPPAERAPEAKPARQAPVYKPDYPLPRPGKGKPVYIPGLPEDIKGVDVSEPHARMPNYKLDLARDVFEAKLRKLGWRAEGTSDSDVTNYFADRAKYSVRNRSKNWDGPSADYFGDGKRFPDMKLRLREEQ